MRPTGVLVRVGVAALVLFVATAGLLGTAVEEGVFGAPTVETAETDLAPAGNDTTEVRARVVVNNPNPVRVPGLVDVEYAARMGGVTLANGSREDLALPVGRSTVRLSTTMDDRRIPEWWVAHVNGGERSALVVTARASGPMGVSRTYTVRNDTVETSILSSLAAGDGRTVGLANESVLVLGATNATWGTATAERTPLSFSTTVRNVHDYPVRLDAVGYEVTANGLTLGSGVVEEDLRVGPNRTGRLSTTVAIDSARMADWWPTHLADDETSSLDVRLYGFVDRDGERLRAPFDLVHRRVRLSTDLLGDEATSVTPVDPPDEGADFARPAVENTTSRWGPATEGTTRIRTTTAVANPNDDPALNDLLELRVEQTTLINGIAVANGSAVSDLGPGENDLLVESAMDNSLVPAWWARHVNRGERSTVTVRPTATVSVGFTRFDAAVPVREGSYETDLLSSLRSTDPEPVAVDGNPVLRIERTNASWGRATERRAPFTATTTVTNRASVPVTVRNVDYVVESNGVTLADATAPESYTVAPGATRTLSFSMALSNRRMDEWWVGHVRGGERSRIDYDVTATVEAGGERREVPIESLSQNRTVTTDVLNATEGG